LVVQQLVNRIKGLEARPFLSFVKDVLISRSPFDVQKAEEVVAMFNGKLNLRALATQRILNPILRMHKGPKEKIEMKPEYFWRVIDECSLHKVNEISTPLHNGGIRRYFCVSV